MVSATQLDTDMAIWGPGARHYQTSDGRHLAVKVDDTGTLADSYADKVDQLLTAIGQPAVASGKHRIVPQPTAIIECNGDGSPIDLTPEHTFPAGTSHDDALTAAGFIVV